MEELLQMQGVPVLLEDDLAGRVQLGDRVYISGHIHLELPAECEWRSFLYLFGLLLFCSVFDKNIIANGYNICSARRRKNIWKGYIVSNECIRECWNG